MVRHMRERRAPVATAMRFLVQESTLHIQEVIVAYTTRCSNQEGWWRLNFRQARHPRVGDSRHENEDSDYAEPMPSTRMH